MNTYADIKKAAGTTTVSTYRDFSTPEGHFLATTILLGVLSTYLMEGTDTENSSARIVGRVEAPMVLGKVESTPRHTLLAYKGDRLKGGEFFLAKSYEEAFARMVNGL